MDERKREREIVGEINPTHLGYTTHTHTHTHTHTRTHTNTHTTLYAHKWYFLPHFFGRKKYLLKLRIDRIFSSRTKFVLKLKRMFSWSNSGDHDWGQFQIPVWIWLALEMSANKVKPDVEGGCDWVRVSGQILCHRHICDVVRVCHNG